MALSRVKTWNAAETLTASDLNAEFNNICNHFGSLDNDDIDSTATFTMGELIVGSGITTADGGQLHVHTASAGSIQAVADADEAVFENSGAAGITILSGTSSTGMIAFGDSGDADIGKISYSHSTNGYTITANAATALQISSAGVVTTGGNVLSDTDSTDDLGSTSVRWANVYTDAIGDSGQALGVKATTLSFDAASTIDTSGNNALTLDAGSAVLTLDGGTLESDATTFSFDAAATIDTSGNNALTLDAGSAVLTLDGGTLESDATTFSFDAAATIDTSGNNNLTLSAGTGTIVATAGDVTIFDDNNNADTSLSIGTGTAEALVIQALNGTSNKTLEELRFTTKTASATGDHGKMSFYVDEAEIATIDDGGIDLASGKSFTVAGSAVGGAALTGSTDNTVVTVSGADAIQGEANLTFDGSTLVNTGQSIGVGEAPSTWASGFDFVQIGGTLALASQPGVQASQSAYIVQNAHYDSDNSWEYQATDEAHRIGMSSGNITFDNAASGTAGNDITWSERMRINASGNVSISGALSKGSGSFRIDHPLPEKTDTHHLVHSFVEAPQADLIYRGTATLSSGTATVNLDTASRMTDGTFVALNTNVQAFTSNESGWDAVRGSVSGNVLTIASTDDTSTATVSWMVVGERKDQHMIDADWTDSKGRVITEPEKPVVEAA